MPEFATRYARAFADAVMAERADTGRIDQQLTDVQQTLAGSRELRTALFNPALATDVRVGVIDALAPKLKLSHVVRNFLAVLLRHERMNGMDEIVAAYRAEMDRRQSIAEVEVVSARVLDDGERRAIEKQAEQVAGSQVRARFREDRALIGGAVVRIGSTVYDGSVRGRLDRMKQELMAG